MRAFEGVKVLDCTHVLAAPFATYQLALLGADVIKVDDPNEPDQSRWYSSDKALKKMMMGTSFMSQGSNKRGIALNLKTEEGRDVIKRLVSNWADVLVQNYRPGAFKALGLGYDDMVKLNPKLIYVSMSAFGQDGPRGHQTAYDPAIAATSGLTAATGTETSGPVKPPAPVIDYSTGMAGAFSISAALYQKMRTGEGQHIDLAMMDVALILQSSLVTNFLRSGHHPERGEKRGFACGSAYETKDGILQISAQNLRQQRRFFEALDLPEMASYSSMDEHAANFQAEWQIISKKMKEKTADEWEAYLQSKHVPAARIREMREMLADPQLKSRRVLHTHENIPDVGKLTVPMAPFKFAHDGPAVDRPPPKIGQHTDEVLAMAGYDAARIASMRKSGAVV